MTRPRNPLPATLRGQRSIPFWTLFLLAVCPIAAEAEPARTVPAQGLVGYVEYDGLDAHAGAWKTTAAYAMFERTPAGAMTADVARQVVDHLLKALPDQEQGGADLLAIQEHVVRHGFSLALYDEMERGASCVVVVNGLGRKDARERLVRLVRFATRAGKADGAGAETFRFQGRDLSQAKGLAAAPPKVKAPDTPDTPKATRTTPTVGLAWWFEMDNLIVVSGPTPPKVDGAKNDAPAPLPLRVSSVIDTIEGKAPSVATHPGYAAALAEGKDIKGFESNGLFFVEVGKVQGLSTRLLHEIDVMNGTYKGLTLPPGKYMHDDVKYFAVPPAGATEPLKVESTPPLLPVPPAPTTTPSAGIPGPKDAGRDPTVSKTGMIPGRTPDGKTKKEVNIARFLGLDGITRVVGRWGFQDKALLTDVRVEAPAPRRGLVGLIDQTGIRKDRLPPIPRGAGAFLFGSCDPVKAYDSLISLWLKGIDPGGAGEGDVLAHVIETLVFEVTGQRVREDILGHFGPAWCLYSAPQRKKGETDTLMPTLLVEVDDAKAFSKVLDALVKRSNAYLLTSQKGDVKPPDALPLFSLERLPAPERGYRLTSPAGIIPWLGEGHQPTVLVGESYVAVAANPTLARAALDAASGRAERWGPSDELAKAFECLPAEITSLTVGDPRDSTWPETVVYLPKLVQHMASAFEVIEGDLPKSSPGSKFLGLLGVPQGGGFRLRIDPDKAPKADALRDQIFPSVLATAVDDLGIRFIAREAIPFACAGPRFRYSGNTKTGETVAIELSPFLFPCFRLAVKHSTKEEGMKFTLGMHGSFAPNEGSDD